MTDTLMVGVSGVRGIVGKDLTPEVVTRWARAFGTWVRENGKRGTGNGKGSAVVVGRDARESGPAFAAAVTTGLTLVGCDVIDVGLVPTPTVQLAVEHHHAGGGIAITASHNPIEWNALKFIGPDGIFLDGAEGTIVTELAAKPAGYGMRDAGCVTTDQGAVERHLDAVLRLSAIDVAGINLETDGRFPRAPEPVPENLGGLSTLVKRAGAALGIAVDPDVDRLAIIDETGEPIGEDYTLAFAIRAAMGGKGGKGGKRIVVCNLSTSLVVEDAARDCGAEVVRTPVGEVHVARAILRLTAVIGGEGNGGVMYPALHEIGRASCRER